MSGNDPVDSFFNCVKEAFLPLEVGIRKATKDLQQCGWGNKGNGVQLIAQVIEDGKSRICGVKNKNKKGFSINVNVKPFFDMFSQNAFFGTWSKEKEVVAAKEDGRTFSNCLQFAVDEFLQKMDDEHKLCSSPKAVALREVKQNRSKGQFARAISEKSASENNEGKHVSFECLVGFMDQLCQTLGTLDKGVQENESGFEKSSLRPLPSSHFSHTRAFANISEWPKVDVNGFLRNLRFAKVNGVPSGVVDLSPSTKEDGDGSATVENKEETARCYFQKVSTDKLSTPLSNVGPIKSTLSAASLTELDDLLRKLQLASKVHPDKKKLIFVQDFHRYTQAEGRRFIEELDRDADGRVTQEDLQIAMKKRKLPRRSILSEAASVAAVQPPFEIPVGSILRSALAGGLSCAFSCALMHPIDTIKTQVQASTLSFPEIISMLPQFGAKGLYMGIIPAIFGQFTSHGLRTGIFETSKLILINVAPTLPEIQVNSILSFCGTILGTTLRIPSEVVKQRLQARLYDNLGEALVGTWRRDGLGGFFRGTGATLCREIPFYVAGMGLYDESKKAVKQLLRRELEPWETVVVGAISGGLAGVTTTPFDVIKTRMMTTQGGQSVSMALVGFSILRQEGPLGLFKGAVPRFFWIAPLGAMNFAGYELVRKALNKIAGDL